MKKILSIFAVIAALGVVLAGCGSKDDAAGGTAGTAGKDTTGGTPKTDTSGTKAPDTK